MKTLLLSLSVLLTFFAHAQGAPPAAVDRASEADSPSTAADRLMPYNVTGSWGFIARDAKGVEFVLQPTYELAYPFRQGRAWVKNDKHWGVIDVKGNVIAPFQFEQVQGGMFKAGVAVVKKDANGLWGAISSDGKLVLDYKFQSISIDENEGRIVAGIPDEQDPSNYSGLSGLYDLAGRPIMPHEYKNIWPRFKGGVTVVEKGGKRALASADGKLLSPLQYDNVFHSDITQFLCVREKEQIYDLYDERGNLRLSAPTPYLGPLYDNRAVFKDGKTKLYGYYDEKGKVALPAQFVLAGAFNEGKAIVQRKTGGAVEAIDVAGKSLGTAANAFIRLDKFKNGHVWLADRTDKKVYYCDATMKRVFPQGFQYAGDFDANGLARADAGGRKYGLINLKGEWVVQPEWSEIRGSSIPGQYIVSADKAKGIVSRTGEVLFKPQNVNIDGWDEQFVKIAPPGFMNTTGEYFCFWRSDGVYFLTQGK